MTPITRYIIAFLLLLIAAFCAYGFAATFESPGFVGWRVAYGVVGGLCLIGVGWAVLAKSRGE